MKRTETWEYEDTTEVRNQRPYELLDSNGKVLRKTSRTPPRAETQLNTIAGSIVGIVLILAVAIVIGMLIK